MTDIGAEVAEPLARGHVTDTLSALTARDSMWSKPARRRRYDNTGYILVGMLLDRVTGEPFPSYLETKLCVRSAWPTRTTVTLNRVLPGRAPGYDHDSTGWHLAPCTSA